MEKEVLAMKFYTPEEAAKMLGISIPMLAYLRRTGRIEGIQAGNTTLYTDEQIKNADLSKRKRGPKSPTKADEESSEFHYAIA